ncbi:hypothetical protein EJ357_44630 [Streptomyces cyaneochromogenes]|uniref:DUF2637 domain-containing protein n=1 Tax=Streptomyces cyaneochromogenes TaxID=2496836 RepID=A0A3Q9EZF6_9ACTN|nr:hypothetical protein [Streptomyces cyaneochromogenes]AZQ39650.1 hypothetical protein EJ357_44630 [Streptomyces cyaneochromogenes]
MLAPMPVKERKARRPIAEVFPDFALFVLGVAGLVLSGWSLSTLLHDQAGAPWPVALFAVAVFDVVAMAACFLVYQRRADPWAAAGARLTMTGALVASAVVNGAHGYALGGWTTAAVLAAAPLAFEVVFELRHRTLTGLIWVLFRKEAMTRLKLDAWERIAVPLENGDRFTVSGRPAEAAATVERIRNGSAQPRPSQAQLTTQEPGSAQLTEPAAQVDELARRLNGGERLTKSSAAKVLGVSEATAGRRLREAKDRVGGGYL